MGQVMALVVILSRDLINRNLLPPVIFNNLHSSLTMDLVEAKVKVEAVVVEGMYNASSATRMVIYLFF